MYANGSLFTYFKYVNEGRSRDDENETFENFYPRESMVAWKMSKNCSE